MKIRKSEINKLVEQVVATKLKEHTDMQMHTRIALAIEDLTLKVRDEVEKTGVKVDPRKLHDFAQNVLKLYIDFANVSRVSK